MEASAAAWAHLGLTRFGSEASLQREPAGVGSIEVFECAEALRSPCKSRRQRPELACACLAS
jgi:hypothetical protein